MSPARRRRREMTAGESFLGVEKMSVLCCVEVCRYLPGAPKHIPGFVPLLGVVRQRCVVADWPPSASIGI